MMTKAIFILLLFALLVHQVRMLRLRLRTPSVGEHFAREYNREVKRLANQEAPKSDALTPPSAPSDS